MFNSTFSLLDLYPELPAACTSAILETKAQVQESPSMFTGVTRGYGWSTLELVLAPTDMNEVLSLFQSGVSKEIRFRVEVPGYKEMLVVAGLVTEISVRTDVSYADSVRVKMMVSEYLVPRAVA